MRKISALVSSLALLCGALLLPAPIGAEWGEYRLTIPAGDDVTPELQLRGRTLWGFCVDGDFAGTAITFFVRGETTPATGQRLVGNDGAVISVTLAGGDCVALQDLASATSRWYWLLFDSNQDQPGGTPSVVTAFVL